MVAAASLLALLAAATSARALLPPVPSSPRNSRRACVHSKAPVQLPEAAPLTPSRWCSAAPAHSLVASLAFVALLVAPLPVPAGEASGAVGGTGAGLTAPTASRPQITLSGSGRVQPPSSASPSPSSGSSSGGGPIVEGLVYLSRSDIRPDLSDVLVLTVDTGPGGEVLAGAKFDVARARFPLSFSLYEANILRGKEEAWRRAGEGDFYVTARTCPEEAVSAGRIPCSDGESTLRARGVSKRIRNLPGMEEGGEIRTAPSLPLSR